MYWGNNISTPESNTPKDRIIWQAKRLHIDKWTEFSDRSREDYLEDFPSLAKMTYNDKITKTIGVGESSIQHDLELNLPAIDDYNGIVLENPSTTDAKLDEEGFEVRWTWTLHRVRRSRTVRSAWGSDEITEMPVTVKVLEPGDLELQSIDQATSDEEEEPGPSERSIGTKRQNSNEGSQPSKKPKTNQRDQELSLERMLPHQDEDAAM